MKAKGMPFNREAALRRMVQAKGRFYDSAEYILKAQLGKTDSQPQKTAYFDTEVTKQEAPKHSSLAGRPSRFQTGGQADDDDDDDDD